MLQQLTEEEIDFYEVISSSIACAEMLFSDADNLTLMEEEKFIDVRKYQYPLLSHEYALAKDLSLSDKKNFQLRKGCGDVWVLGGRLFGKTKIVEQIDLLVSIFLLDHEKCGFTSFDAIHIRGVLEEIIPCLEHHPFFKLFTTQITRSPNYRFAFKTGYSVVGINMNLTGKDVGHQFFQLHLTRLYIEEASKETDEVYRRRRDSVSEFGCIFRGAGMTDFTKYTPAGKVFYDIHKRGFVVNLPQLVNPNWGPEQKDQAIKDFGGEQSLPYRIFVKGEVVEDGVSVFDMNRIRQCYDDKKEIQTFEVKKEQFHDYKFIINVERMKQADYVYIFADIGEAAPTEIGVVFQVGNKYRYVYNITLYNLSHKEQAQIFEYLGIELEANFIGVDQTDGTGRAIFRELEEKFPKQNLIRVHFAEKIPIDFERDQNSDHVIFKDGYPVYKEEYVRHWAVHNLKSLFYGNKMEMPIDYKFDSQINQVQAIQMAQRIEYKCVAPADHLYQAFQVFSIMQWLCEFLIIKPIMKKQFAKRGVVN